MGLNEVSPLLSEAGFECALLNMRRACEKQPPFVPPEACCVRHTRGGELLAAHAQLHPHSGASRGEFFEGREEGGARVGGGQPVSSHQTHAEAWREGSEAAAEEGEEGAHLIGL